MVVIQRAIWWGFTVFLPEAQCTQAINGMPGTHSVSNAVPLSIIDDLEKFKPSQEQAPYTSWIKK